MASAFDRINESAASNARKARDAEMKKTFDKNSHTLPNLAVGDKVLIQGVVLKKWDREGRVRECDPNGRSYTIEFEDGGPDLRRNRRFLRKI